MNKELKYYKEVYPKQREKVLKHNYEHVNEYGFYNPLISGSIDGTDEIEHDRAIVRALYTSYKPKPNPKSNSRHTLFIGNLDYQTNEEILTKHFSKYGALKSMRLVRDLVTGFSKGYAFIEYESRSNAKYAYGKCSSNYVLDGRSLIVEYEYERELKGWKPRRLGGGLGGHKISGQLRFGGRYRPFRRIFHRKF